MQQKYAIEVIRLWLSLAVVSSNGPYEAQPARVFAHSMPAAGCLFRRYSEPTVFFNPYVVSGIGLGLDQNDIFGLIIFDFQLVFDSNIKNRVYAKIDRNTILSILCDFLINL